jgi:heme exporter protein A
VQLVAEDLVVERGARRVIDGLSFSVAGGEALVLTGANGSGKTTLLRTLAGFIRPVRGTVWLEGGDTELTIAEQAHVVGHASAVRASLTVVENTAFWGDYLGSSTATDERFEVALRHFGLDDLGEFPAAYLSAGQKRRLGLARLLVADRPLWLLDEPTVSLDTASSERRSRLSTPTLGRAASPSSRRICRWRSIPPDVAACSSRIAAWELLLWSVAT